MRSLYIGLAALLLPASLAAQKLTAGIWTGTVTPPDGPTLEVTFDVRMSGDTTKITLKGPPGEFPLTDVKAEPTRLLFSFSPGGDTVRCTLLLKEDKSYSGDCLDDRGGKGVIVMRPPKPGA